MGTSCPRFRDDDCYISKERSTSGSVVDVCRGYSEDCLRRKQFEKGKCYWIVSRRESLHYCAINHTYEITKV